MNKLRRLYCTVGITKTLHLTVTEAQQNEQEASKGYKNQKKETKKVCGQEYTKNNWVIHLLQSLHHYRHSVMYVYMIIFTMIGYHIIGYIFYKNYDYEVAMDCFTMQVKLCNKYFGENDRKIADSNGDMIALVKINLLLLF
jgi:hypothetical protein